MSGLLGWRKAWLARGALLAVLALHLGLTAHWMWRTGYFARPPTMDGPYFRMEVAPMVDALEQDGLAGWLEAGRTHDKRTPPLMHMVTALVTGLTGRHEIPPSTLWLTTAFFWSVLVLGVWNLARAFGGPGFAALAALIAASAPVLITWMRPYYRQMPMAALEVWCLAFLVRSDGFRRSGASLAAGVFAGLGLLVKELVPVYVGGSALAALVLGLRRPGLRTRTLLHAALALAAAALVASFWYWEHLPLVFQWASSVTGSAGQRTWSQGVPLWSFERWLYYPLHFVNGGFGLPLVLLAVAAAWAGRGRRTEPAPGAAPAGAGAGAAGVVAFGPLVAYPVITVGQVEALATFTVDFVPAAAVGLAGLLVRVPAGRARAAFAAATLAACAWQTWASYRAPDDDHPIPRGSPLVLADETDVLITAKWPSSALRCAPDAEPWPVRDFARTILEESHLPVPRLAVIPVWQEPHADAWNVAHEAWALGGRVKLVGLEKAAWTQGAELLALVESADWFVLAHRLNLSDPDLPPLTSEQMRAAIEATELPLEIVDTREVTATATVSLVRRRRPWAGEPVRPASALDGKDVIRGEAVFENGWRLLGWQPVGLPDNRFAVVTFWDGEAGPPAVLGFAMPVRTGAGGHARWAAAIDRPWRPAGPGTVLAIPTDPMPLPAEAGLASRGKLALREKPLRGGKPGAPVLLRSTTFPRAGRETVILTP